MSIFQTFSILNIYLNYICHKTVLCDDKDPPWMTNGIRTAMEMQNNADKEYITSGMRHDYYVHLAQPAITSSKLTIKTLEQGVEYVQS